MTPFWTITSGPNLAQGDFLPGCLLPVFLDPARADVTEISIARSDLIVVTQSCDLENGKVQFVASCPIHTLSTFERSNPAFAKKAAWENVRKGRVEGLHLLASPLSPEDNRSALVVDFGQIVSLPLEYLQTHASQLAMRNRLASPFLEHFSQAFARFFMRVGLPTQIPPFK